MSPQQLSSADFLTTVRPKSPYPGLRPFEADEWSTFFGREQMIDEVIERLAAHRLVLIHGASGSGKSSLARAGVLPRLAGQHLRVGTPWQTFSMRPSGGPLWNLATAFAQLEGRAEDVARVDEIVRAFSRRDATLASVFALFKGAEGRRLCILVDQFEELFRFEKETSREEAELFVALLLRNNRNDSKDSDISPQGVATGKADAPATVHVVVTMRSEFLGECGRFKGLAEAINRTQYLLPAMDRDALMRAIRRPATLYAGEVSLELAERLIAEAAGREDELPLIQHGLMHLWNHAWNAAVAKAKPGEKIKIVLGAAALEQAGGLVNLLSKHADTVLAEAAPDIAHRFVVERLFRALTDLNVDGRGIRRPQAFRELVAVTETAPDTLRQIIDLFRRDNVSFLTPYSKEPITDSTPIDISHEALIRCWSKLADQHDGWLKREFDDGLVWRSLLVEAKGFETNKRRILSPATTEERWKWWQERHVNPPWAARYGGNFLLVEKLVDASRRNAARQRQLQYGLIVMLLFTSCAGIAAAIWTNSEYFGLRWQMWSGPKPLAPAIEAALEPEGVFLECAHCPQMVVVPAGKFMMGEKSQQHEVTIAKPFAVSKFEVTFEEWDTCVTLGGCSVRPRDQGWGRGTRPVINVSEDDAKEYVTWLSKWTGKDYRLLSEAEWEYAARAGSTTNYSWGDDIKKDGKPMANCKGCDSEWDGKQQTAPVGSFPHAANAFGLHDMHGNVVEWVEDCWHGSYEGAPTNGSAWTDGDCSRRVVRGGSWYKNPEYLGSAVRSGSTSNYRDDYQGFRVARTIRVEQPNAAEERRKAEEAMKADEERKARAAAADAEARRRAEEAEQQRLAAVKADEERKAKAAAADAEARRKAEEAEQQRLAALKADEERKAKAAAAGAAHANDELIKMSQNPKDWVMPTGNYANQRYSELKQITAANVGNLQATWGISTGVLRGHEGGPLVLGDIMYVHGPFPNPVLALDLKSDGKILWKYEPKQDPNVINVICCDTVNRGLAYADGKIFLHQADTTLVALDAKYGKVVWQAKNGDPSKGQTGTSAPMVVKDKVLVGISGGEFGVQCHVTAYDLKTGKRTWRAFSVGPDDQILVDPVKTTSLGKPVGKDSSLKTWQGDQWKIGGGCTWGWISYDPQLNLIYYGSGNPSTWNPSQRPGDNKWSMTIFARDPDTGTAKWVYQMTPHDEWHYDGVNEMILTDQQIGGQMRKLLTHFDKNGLGYTLDRDTGELLVAEKYDPKVNWTTGVDMNKSSPTYGRPRIVPQYSTERQDVNVKGICPSSMGTKNQQPAAFSPDTGLFYVPTTHLCMDYEPFRVSYTAGQPYVGATLSMYPPPGESNTGNFIAWDGKTGKIVWSVPEQFSVWSGALATAGGVVFYGTLEGYLKAVDAKTGKQLYKFKVPSGIVGNVMTYEHGGEQYIAVLSGVGGWAGIGLAAGLTDPTAGLGAVGAFAGLRNYTQLGGQLIVFALP